MKDYPEAIIKSIDRLFPKGDKRRGDALVLQAIAYVEGKRHNEGLICPTSEINDQRKKDDEVTLATESIHPEPRSNTEEDNRKSVKTDVVDNHVDNPQDDPGKASGADNGDTGDGTFPADSTHNLKDNKLYKTKIDNSCY